jgi:hypothetical protein
VQLRLAKNVIPGHGEAASPESMTTGLWKMDSGLTAARRPGMTAAGANRWNWSVTAAG